MIISLVQQGAERFLSITDHGPVSDQVCQLAQANPSPPFLYQILHPIALLHNPHIIHIILPAIALMIFIETGLLFPLLPGDSLLFAGGMVASQGVINIWSLILAIPLAAWLGDQSAYFIGRFFGSRLMHRQDSRFFKHSWLEESQAFFERNGTKTIILARFVPIVRTFSAVIAGVGRMNYVKFFSFDIIGAILWGAGVTLLGYWLGQIGFIRKNIEEIFIVIVLITIAPAIVKAWKARSANKKVNSY